MLARFRSASDLEPPTGFDEYWLNMAREYEDLGDERNYQLVGALTKWQLPEDQAEKDAVLQAKFGTTEPLGTAFRIWSGPLEGVVYQLGQFPALQEGPAGDGVPPPPPELAEALAADLDLLVGLVDTFRPLTYNSEADYGVLPIILEPRPAAGLGSSSSGTAAGGPEGGQRPCWWSIQQALSVPLSKEELYASLGLARGLEALFDPELQFESGADWIREMVDCMGSTDAGEEEEEQAKAVEAALTPLAAAVSSPIYQISVGWEGGWSPVPMVWMGRSKRSGALLGLLSGVVGC